MARRVAAVLIVLALAATAAAVTFRPEPDPFATLSNWGRPGETEGFEPVGPGPEGNRLPSSTGSFLMARRGNYEFFRVSLADGTSCWGAKKRYSAEEGIIARSCQQQSAFPSRDTPLLDFSTLEQPEERYPRLIRLAGFAADGVERIAVVDPDRHVVPAVRVEDNVYFTETLPAGDFYGLAALDAAGKVIWRGLEAQQPAE